jgi:hypothetical protein
MPKNFCIMQIWAEPEKAALPICNYSQILYQFLTFTQNLKRSPNLAYISDSISVCNFAYNSACTGSCIFTSGSASGSNHFLFIYSNEYEQKILISKYNKVILI